MTRRIAHLDMDAFFASVELLNYPDLQGQAVAVGGSRNQQPVLQPDGRYRYARLSDYAGRGVLTTATYAARALGIHSGMGTMKAARLAPDVILLPAHFDEYRKYSRLFKAAVAAIAPSIEDRGIDEIYIDLTQLPGETEELAQRLKRAVHTATGLSCSIGISPNKLLSKIASDLDKPDGITIIRMEDLPRRIWPLPVRKINGIGPKAEARLTALGLHTIGELAAALPHRLVEQFGASYGNWLHEAANGIDIRPLETHSEPKSISRETTFERDLHPRHDRAALGEVFTTLCRRVAADLERQGYVGRTVGIKLRYDDFRTVTRDLTLPVATAAALTIRRAAGECLKRVPLEQKLRLLGVRISALQADDDPDLQTPPQQGELDLSPRDA
ncbi:MAG: DNA polymerase IV [Sterolibacterium sp.]|jgi:DNA polymerase-4|nr:DNA polymerase IV [Sterolibacterium sp.]